MTRGGGGAVWGGGGLGGGGFFFFLSWGTAMQCEAKPNRGGEGSREAPTPEGRQTASWDDRPSFRRQYIIASEENGQKLSALRVV